jgi:hypothetical protein
MVSRVIHAIVANSGISSFTVTEIHTAFSTRFLTAHIYRSYFGSHGKAFLFHGLG